jgi:hypothetical protein
MSQAPVMVRAMEFTAMDEAIKQIEKSNIDLEPEVLDAHTLRELLSRYAKAKKLVSYGETMLAAKLDDAAVVAHATGVSLGKAKAAVDTGKSLKAADEVRDAFKSGEISLDQASEIAKAEHASPGSSPDLLKVSQEESFQTLREKSRKVVLEAEQHRGLAERQHGARRARSYHDELGMISINLLFEPHVGVPIVNRAEAEAERRFRSAKNGGRQEPFERHLADAYACLLSGGTTIKPRKPELVVLVSHEIAKRGWKEVHEGEVCKIPGDRSHFTPDGQGHCLRCLPDGTVLRRHGSASLSPVDPQHSPGSSVSAATGRAAGVRRCQVH